jgi:DNA-binding CsgD family transcriptional regulator
MKKHPDKKKGEFASGGWGPAVRELFGQGLKKRDIAKKLGISRAAVYYHLSYLRNPGNKIVRTHTRGNMKRVAELTKQGWIATRIAEELGIAVSTVYVHRNHAREAGLLENKDYGQRQIGRENDFFLGKNGVRADGSRLEHPRRVPRPVWMQRDRT